MSASSPEEEDGIGALATSVAESGAELAVVHLPGRLWVPALEADGLAATGGCLLVSLPSERSLAALAVEELARRRLPCRVATRPPGQLAARRALAGARPGGWVSEMAARDREAAARTRTTGPVAAGEPGAGAACAARRRADPDPGGSGAGCDRRRRDRQRARAAGRRPGGDLGCPQHARRHPEAAGARDGFPGEPRTRATSPEPSSWSEPAWPRSRRPGATGSTRRASGSISPTPRPIRRSGPARRWSPRSIPGRLPGGERLGDRSPIRVVASAVAEASAPVSSWTGMPSQAEGGGYSGPLAYRDGEGMRPDVAAAYDRMAAGGPARGPRPAGRLGLPLRRGAGPALRSASGSALGGAAGALAAPLRDRARPRALVGLRLAARARVEVRLPAPLSVGALALRLRRRPAAVLRGRQRAERYRFPR